MTDPIEQQQIDQLVHEIEALRLKRKQAASRHASGKRFSQDELRSTVYASYKNMLLGRTQRLPDRAALLQIADYLECTPSERNALLQAAQYALEALPEMQRRKQTTVLLGNFFVPLVASLDVEDAAELMNRLWTRVEAIISAYRGILIERTGTGLLALWSIETTYEDDPEQAIRAALALQPELQTFGADLRVGVHTGQAFLQTMSHNQQMHVSGEVVNIASQLSRIAPNNTILISHSTYSHVNQRFDLTPIGAELPFAIYRVERITSVASPIVLHGSQEVDTPLIGREVELESLQAPVATVLSTGKQHIITISGEAGIGKSRLLYEFNEWLQHSTNQFFSFKGRASQSSQTIPYALLRSTLSSRFQITDDDFPEVTRQKIETGFAEILRNAETAQKAAHIISHLLSFNLGDSPHIRDSSKDAQEFFELALGYLHQYFSAIAARSMVVIMLEDIHWADDSSLILFKRLSAMLTDKPILIICTTRPDPTGSAPNWETASPLASMLDLHPLTLQDSYHLLAELLPTADSVPALRDLIANTSNGNPLYIEELVKMLTENGTLFKRAEQWTVNHAQLATVQVPTTLTALIQARFDHLSPSQQRLLQVASVFGRVFWDGGIKFLASHEDSLPTVLDELCRQKIIFRQKKSTFRGYTEYAFKHALLCDAIYETILKHDRLIYHAAAARWLANTAAKNQRSDELAGLIAYHFKAAALADESANWYQRAGKAAAARFANNEALTYLSCALDQIPLTNTLERYMLLAARERVQDALGLREEQAHDLAALLDLATAMNDPYRQVEASVRQTNYAYLMGHYAEVVQLARTAIALAQTIGADQYQASCYVMLGNVLWDQGDQDGAHTCFEQALHLAGSTK